MIDFVKMDRHDLVFAQSLLHNPLLNFSSNVNLQTGEILNPVEEASHKNLNFRVYPSGRVEIAGSLHKFWNNGLHNYNDFNLTSLNEVIMELVKYFNVDPCTVKIHNLEVGVNIVTPFNPNLLINNLLTHKSEQFNKMKVAGQGHGRDVKYEQYEVKVYNKGLQYRLHEYLLRFEIKYTRMARLGLGHIYLMDLGQIDFLRQCLAKLLVEFDELIITEKIDKRFLSRQDRKLYDLGNNPRSWADMAKNRRCTNKANFNNLINDYGPLQLRKNTITLLEKKGLELISCPPIIGTF